MFSNNSNIYNFLLPDPNAPPKAERPPRVPQVGADGEVLKEDNRGERISSRGEKLKFVDSSV